jgi:hypothetical protein
MIITTRRATRGRYHKPPQPFPNSLYSRTEGANGPVAAGLVGPLGPLGLVGPLGLATGPKAPTHR